MKVTKRITRNGPDVYSWRDMIKGSLIVIGSFAGFYAFIMFLTGGILK
ncbi:MAG TPA: hypothetical protein VFM31_13040 [Nitrososphaeraceae archaeon]|nr:hypothetical protein [Nitrososphaeraceae archaeon]HJT82860.1 hypothetical protein [Nitrososphaeraceae archaeon]